VANYVEDWYNKIMKKKEIDKKTIFKYITMGYFMLSPVFDTVFLYNHITTLLRVFVLLVFVLATLIMYKNSRKKFKYLLAYYLASLVYLFINYSHSRGFVSLVPGDFNYSLISEATTIMKLCMPFTVFFIMKYQEYTKDEFFRVINVWAVLIAGSIVACNICGYSLSSYTGEITRYSIFDWGKGLDVSDIATKGFFMYSNQIGIILLMLFVLSIYQMFYMKKRTCILTIIIFLACLMIGSRVSTYGGLLTVIVICITYIIYSLIFKRKISKMLFCPILISILWIVILPITPNNDRVHDIEAATKEEYDSDNNIVIDNKTDDIEESVIDKNEDLLYIENNFNEVIFSKSFYKDFYPYEYDTEFWIETVNNQSINSYRKMEMAIIKRVWSIDDRKSDYLFGISNSRIQNIVNVEVDFVLHFFAFGIVGMIVTLFFYLYSGASLSMNVLKKKEFIDLMILACFGLFIVGSFVSGNSVNFLATIVPLSFVVSFCGKYSDC